MSMNGMGEEHLRMLGKDSTPEEYVGTVEDHNDPEKRGRLRVRIPEVYGNIRVEYLPWANPTGQFGGGNNYGIFMIPPKGAQVRVRFWRGNPWFPEWYGINWFLGEVPMEGALNPPTNYVIKTPKGHVLDFYDDGPHIRLKDFHGNYVIINGRTDSWEILMGGDELKDIAAGSHESVGDVKITKVGGDYHIDVGGNVNIRAAGLVNIDATQINLNCGKARPQRPRTPADVDPKDE